jgi:hypothetical protein
VDCAVGNRIIQEKSLIALAFAFDDDERYGFVAIEEAPVFYVVSAETLESCERWICLTEDLSARTHNRVVLDGHCCLDV